MPPKQNPFSLYDFLGYFTPGAIVIYGCLVLTAHAKGSDSLSLLIDVLTFDRPEVYVPFVLFAYVLGHLISYLSSITIERYALWTLGYPSAFLFSGPASTYWVVDSSTGSIRRVLRSLVGLLMLPVMVADVVLEYLGNIRTLYAKKMDSTLEPIIRASVEELVQARTPNRAFTIDDRGDYFRYVYHYAVEHAPNHLPKMQNYVALYGFMRNISLMSLFLFWIVLIHLLLGLGSSSQIAYVLGATTLLCFFSYIGFVKFYRRFTLEALMAIAVIDLSD